MKDIYELLNDVNIDISEYEKLEVTMTENMKKKLNKNMTLNKGENKI